MSCELHIQVMVWDTFLQVRSNCCTKLEQENHSSLFVSLKTSRPCEAVSGCMNRNCSNRLLKNEAIPQLVENGMQQKSTYMIYSIK